MKKHFRKLTLLVAVFGIMSVASACAPKRILTSMAWMDVQGRHTTLYAAYWEGKCMGNSCSRGESRVKQCVLDKRDNSLQCRQAEDAERALNP